MKKLVVALIICSIIGLSACGYAKTLEIHALQYPDGYATTLDEYGSDSFAGTLNHTDTIYYAINDFYNMKSKASLHILNQFETYQQTTEYTCGTASALMVLNWYGIDSYDEMAIADIAETDSSTGTSVEGLVTFFSELGWNVDYHAETGYYFDTVDDFESYVIECIDAGTPIMVDWVDWAGHWQVITGIDTCGTESPYDDVLILADPYDVTDHYQDGYYTYPLGRFFNMWREGPCADKAKPYVQSFVTAKPSQE